MHQLHIDYRLSFRLKNNAQAICIFSACVSLLIKSSGRNTECRHIDYKSLHEEAQLRIVQLEHELMQLKKLIYGSKAERLVASGPGTSQLSLDMQTETVPPVAEVKKISYVKATTIAVLKNVQHP